jgi:hypothetical protein
MKPMYSMIPRVPQTYKITFTDQLHFCIKHQRLNYRGQDNIMTYGELKSTGKEMIHFTALSKKKKNWADTSLGHI